MSDKTKSVNMMSVLRDTDEAVDLDCFEGRIDLEAELEPGTSVIGLRGIHFETNAEGNSFEEELEKEERDWSLVPNTFEAVIDRNEEGIMSSLQDLDVLLSLEEEAESRDDELSSNEGDKEVDPLEDVGFSLGNFMSDSSFCNGSEGIKAVEDKLDNFCKMKEKEVSVVEVKVHVDTSEGSNSRKPLKQFKRRRGGSLKEGRYNNQKLSAAFQSTGKLGKFLASMNFGLINLKIDRKTEGNSVKKLETSDQRELATGQSVDNNEMLGLTQILK